MVTFSVAVRSYLTALEPPRVIMLGTRPWVVMAKRAKPPGGCRADWKVTDNRKGTRVRPQLSHFKSTRKLGTKVGEGGGDDEDEDEDGPRVFSIEERRGTLPVLGTGLLLSLATRQLKFEAGKEPRGRHGADDEVGDRDRIPRNPSRAWTSAQVRGSLRAPPAPWASSCLNLLAS